MSGPGVPSGAEEVTSGWLQQVLQLRHGPSYQLTKAEPEPLHIKNHVAVCSHMLCFRCQGRRSQGATSAPEAVADAADDAADVAGDETDHLLVKLMPLDAGISAMLRRLHMPQCETGVYGRLLPSLMNFEASRGCNFVKTMTVDCFYAELSYVTVSSVTSENAGSTELRQVLKPTAKKCQKITSGDREMKAAYTDTGPEAEDQATVTDGNAQKLSIRRKPTRQISAGAISNNQEQNNEIEPPSSDVQFVIVLENLQPAGFWTPGQLELAEQPLFAAVQQLARLAATSNAWIRHYNLHDLPYLITTSLPPDHIVGNFICVGVSKMEPVLKQRDRLGLLGRLKRMQQRSVQLINEHLKPPSAELRVMSHGDFRGGNLLLRHTPAAGWQVRVVDWQVSWFSHPCVDLVYLLMLSVPRDLMKRLEGRVLEVYWAAFRDTCQALGEDCHLVMADLVEQFQRVKLLGLLWCLSGVNLWDRVPGWPEHCVDIAMEVDALGLLQDFECPAE